MKSFFLRVYGCQMNFSDADRVRELLFRHGWTQTENPLDAQAILAISCSVRAKAENRVLSFLSSHQSLAETGAVIGLLGCTANLHREKLFKQYPFLSIICGPNFYHCLPEMLESAIQGEKVVLAGESEKPFLEQNPERITSISASVVITKGCENFCTYCVVPRARGVLVSRKPDEILSEIGRLVAQGAREIVLLGQNVNEYGNDFAGHYHFAELLADAAKVPGLLRLRFLTSHPRDTGERILTVMRDNPVVCRHIHLPVQSGSDRILALMGRKYTRSDFIRIVELARDMMPDIAITSDVMVGFPGETEDDFLQTYELVRTVKFHELFMFKYSVRPFTRASAYKDSVPDREKERRHRLIMELQEKIGRDIALSYVGRSVEVLVEKSSMKSPKNLLGRTGDGKLVQFEGDRKMIGGLVTVEITGAKTGYLTGKLSR